MDQRNPQSEVDSLDALRSTQEAAWRAGKPIRVEEILARLSQPASFSDDSRLDLIYGEILLREEQGETPRLEEYVARFAHLSQRLRRLFEVQQSLNVGPLPSRSDGAPVSDLSSVRDDGSTALWVERSGKPNAGAHREGPAAGERDGRWLGDYEILGEVARGGMGVVYKARQASLNRIVALKMIRAGELASEADVRRFHVEAEAAAKLDHPGIVPIYEVGAVGGQHFYSMGFVEGRSLAALLIEGPLPPRQAAEMLFLVARAMEYAHQHGVIHRDLKPANILLQTRTAESGTRKSESSQNQAALPSSLPRSEFQLPGFPRVTDFGLAKQRQVESDLTSSGQILGTPSFMPPEQARGDTNIGPTADVYSLGAVLYAMLTGRPPFQTASVLETLKQVIEREPVSPRSLNPEVNRDLETICLKCLQKEPSKRYGSAGELSDDLWRFVAGEEILARPISHVERAWRWCRRRPSTAALVAVTCLVPLIGVPLALWYQGQLRAAEAERIVARGEASAAQQVAAAQEYYAALNEARQIIIRGRQGWVPSALTKLEKAARLDTPVRNPVELRTEAAQCLNAIEGRERGAVAKEMQAGQVAFSADGKWLAVGEFKAQGMFYCRVRVVDLATEANVYELGFATLPLMFNGVFVQDGCRQMSFSPDGRWLAVGVRSGKVHAWDLSQAPPKYHSWNAHGQTLTSTLFSPDSSRLYTTAQKENTVKAWSYSETGVWKETAQHRAEGETDFVSHAGRSDYLVLDERPAGAPVATHITFLDAASLNVLERTETYLRGHVVAGPWDKTVLVGNGGKASLDIPGKPSVRSFEDEGPYSGAFHFASFSDDGRLLLLVTQGAVIVWDTVGAKVIFSTRFESDVPHHAAISADGSRLAVVAKRRVVLYDVDSHLSQSFVRRRPGAGGSIVWGPPGMKKAWDALAGAAGAELPPEHLVIDNSSDAALIQSFHYEDVSRLRFHRAAGRLAYAFVPEPPGGASDVQIWQLGGQAPRRLASKSIPKLNDIAWSGDGQSLLGISSNDQIWSWNVATVVIERRFNHWLEALVTGESYLNCLAAGRDRLLVGTRLGELIVLPEGAADPQRRRLNCGPLLTIALTPAEDIAACGTGSGEVLLVDVSSGSTTTLIRHDGDVRSVEFSPDGRYLASASTDRSVRLWRYGDRRAEELLSVTFPAAVREARFHPSRNVLAIRVERELAVRLLDLDQLQAALAERNLGWTPRP